MTAALFPLWLTLKVALLATLASGIVGIGFALAIARSRLWAREGLDGILMLPMVLPPTVLGYYLIVVIGRNGWIGRWLDDHFGVSLMFSWQGAVVAASIVSLPLIYKAARAAFEEVDRNLENAARLLGSNEVAVFLRVTLPLALRGIGAGLMLSFARAMGEFGATLMIAGNIPGRTQTLSIAIYDAVQAGDDYRAGLLSLIMSAVCITMLVFSGQLLRTRH
jgi:molybdate transport system permease protein